jgi:chromosome segregation ATPase
MANDNNNINELVADDDDPTVELESPNFARIEDGDLEADAPTFDSKQDSEAVSLDGVTVSELQSDLRSRQKTISKLQYDIEQLHAKWLGLETEISAREAQTGQLHEELSSTRDAVARKETLLKKRDRSIKSLKAEIRSRNEEFTKLQFKFEKLQRRPDAETNPRIQPGSAADRSAEIAAAPDLLAKLRQSERYADSLRQSSQDLLKTNDSFGREIASLRRQLDKAITGRDELSQQLESTKANVDELRKQLGSIENKHQDEIRILRFELGHAQDTVVETEDLNSQLASDLVDARGFKDELERMLGDVEENSSQRIAELEKQVSKLKRVAESHEQKLATKSEAISILLAELAKKSEQIESIGEIEDVIQDIDERMSERSVTSAPSVDRITRVLIGTVGEQVLRFPLFKDRLTIGRTRDNDIQLEAAYVSRRHAVVQTDGDLTRIIDWGSKNGIYINSVRASEHFLKHGDVVTIGNARFRYEERKKRDS